jgi:transcription-repair coupling factor (superfamily II helicase)
VARGAQPLVWPIWHGRRRRQGQGRAVFIASDDAALRAIVESAAFFAPELDVIDFRRGTACPSTAPPRPVDQRAAAGGAAKVAAQARRRPQLLVTTINAVLQRTLTPFRIRESTRLLTPGVEIGRESLIALLQRQGYSRTDTVVDAGEYAVRGSVFDIYPTGLDHGLRLDFFGDELETLRLFDPTTQRSVQPVETHLLLPASEALLDETSIKRFRSRYREIFGANATSDRSIRRSAKAAAWPAWSTGCPARRADGHAVRPSGRRRSGGARRCRRQGRRNAAGRYRRLSTPAPRRRPANRAPIARSPMRSI